MSRRGRPRRPTPRPGSGVDANYAKSIPGGKGENIRITDIEYSWNTSHEDLSKARATGATLSMVSAAAAAQGRRDRVGGEFLLQANPRRQPMHRRMIKVQHQRQLIADMEADAVRQRMSI